MVLYLLLSGILGVSLVKDQFYVNFLAWGFLVVQVVDIWTLNFRQAHDWGFEFSWGTIFPHLESGQRWASFDVFLGWCLASLKASGLYVGDSVPTPRFTQTWELISRPCMGVKIQVHSHFCVRSIKYFVYEESVWNRKVTINLRF